MYQTETINEWDGQAPKINSGAVPFLDAKSPEKE